MSAPKVKDVRDELFTRRGFLIITRMIHGAEFADAAEEVSSLAVEHPEWDMQELRTFHEWAKA